MGTAEVKQTMAGRFERLPPQLYFVTSAVFHYLGPAFAVLLFAAIAPLGVAWLRIASAAIIFALWRRPWRFFGRLSAPQRRVVIGLGVVLGLMNGSFYLALERLSNVHSGERSSDDLWLDSHLDRYRYSGTGRQPGGQR